MRDRESSYFVSCVAYVGQSLSAAEAMQSIVMSLVLTPQAGLRQLNCQAPPSTDCSRRRMPMYVTVIFAAQKFEPIVSLVPELHQLRVPQRIEFQIGGSLSTR